MVRRSLPFLAAPLLLLAAAPMAAAPSAPPAPLEVRFHPSREIRSYEAEARRGVTTLVLQNAAVIAHGDAPVEVTGGAFELWQGDQLLLATPLSPAALEALAARSGRLAASGAIQALAFQFDPERLLAGATVTGSRTLRPGEALLVGSRIFLVQAPADRLVLRLEGRLPDGRPVAASGELPVRNGGSAATYGFPLQGTWYVGAAATPHSHHRWAVPEEFALDLVRLEGGESTHRSDGSRLSDYAAWGAPVRSVADGTVVAAVDRFPDSESFLRAPGESDEAYFQRTLQQQNELMTQGEDAIVGNHVVVEHAGGEYSVYAHLRSGSVVVKAGDRVTRGQTLGGVGSSGNSSEPHLHFQLGDGPSPLRAAGIPVRFEGIRIVGADWERQVQTGDLVLAP